MKTEQRVLYFSLNSKSIEAFYAFVDRTRLDRSCSFRLIEKQETTGFLHASDLIFFLDQQDNVGNLYVIIDYISFYNNHCKYSQEITKQSFSVKRAADIIRRAILKYPEVMFLFDESWKRDMKEEEKQIISNLDFTTFLFYGKNRDFARDVFKEYHQYDVANHEGVDTHPFAAMTRERSNLFDGSNLRYRVLQYMYDDLLVKQQNFESVQNTRNGSLALCIEEEYSQNRFNSYALYANGFRVIPIHSAQELKKVNDDVKNERLKPVLVVRDYDLQFSDENSEIVETISIDGCKIDIYATDYIRGVKFIEEGSSLYKDRWHIVGDPSKGDNDYWSELLKSTVVFVSKGGPSVPDIVDSESRYEKKRKEYVEERMKYFHNLGSNGQELNGVLSNEMIDSFSSGNEVNHPIFLEGAEKQVVLGLVKPVSGLYLPFHSFKIIRDSHDKTKPPKNTEIDTSRMEHKHGTPLDLYDLVNSMIDRASFYYNSQKYIKASIVASVAIEVLNGFHEALMLQAYRILAISENAIAMDIIGGNEAALKADAQFRIRKIESDVERMLYRKNRDRRNLEYNILDQIFVDCRNFCQEHEHFEAEECFLSAIGHVNEGYSISDVKYEIGEIIELIKKGWISIRDYLNQNEN